MIRRSGEIQEYDEGAGLDPDVEAE